MQHLARQLIVLIYLAASALLLNDVVRCVYSSIRQLTTCSAADHDCQNHQDDNTFSAFSVIEEEVKHTNERPEIHVAFPEIGLNRAIEHLIMDDEVRHLAYIPVFSPPPDRA